MNQQYNAACSYALANNPDSAFFCLNHIASYMNYTNYGHITTDPDLKSLHSDSRWTELIKVVKANKDKAYASLDFVTLDKHKIEVFLAGMQNNQSGKPVIVFENGMADNYTRWALIIDEISKTHTVFAYNRPRIGESEDDSLPPTTKHIIENLREMLIKKGLKPPYVLVSHSFGGAYIRSFASDYPNEIAGLVFVDPVDFIKAGGFANTEPPTIYDREKMWRINSNIQIKRWMELLYPLKYRRFFYSSSSGHMMQTDDPEIVISSIKLALSDFDKILKESTSR